MRGLHLSCTEDFWCSFSLLKLPDSFPECLIHSAGTAEQLHYLIDVSYHMDRYLARIEQQGEKTIPLNFRTPHAEPQWVNGVRAIRTVSSMGGTWCARTGCLRASVYPSPLLSQVGMSGKSPNCCIRVMQIQPTHLRKSKQTIKSYQKCFILNLPGKKTVFVKVWIYWF